jgi:hypothetical protein
MLATLHFVLVTNPQLFATIISLAVQCLTVFRTWRKRIDSRRLVWFLSQLFGLARVAIGKSSQSGISKYQHHRSRSVGHYLVMDPPFFCQRCVAGLARAEVLKCYMARPSRCRLPLWDCHNHTDSQVGQSMDVCMHIMSSLGSSFMSSTYTCHQVISILLIWPDKPPPSPRQKAKQDSLHYSLTATTKAIASSSSKAYIL